MCRIAGIVSNTLPASEISGRVGIMCDALRHGGPDDQGIFLNEEGRLAFGHRRLAIIDLSKNGHQPMADVQKRAWITFNGEIYNFFELKEQLVKAGSTFYSNTDTEVILAAYLQWGTPAFSKFRGMFAFALYDVEKATTYLVRDTSGIKPLYYHINNDGLSFASEIKAFKAAGIATDADPAWAIRFLALGNIPEPYTTLKNVFSLAKGHYLSWHHPSATYKIVPYQEAPPVLNYITDIEVAKEYIHNTFKTAIERQLISDAPIGVFLSGGIDSSLLSLLVHEQHRNLKTISIYFNEKSYDERAYQNIVLDRLSGEKFAHLVQQHDFETFLPQIINSMDMPTTDGINSWFISKYAHEDGLKAVLSGVGADELFGGYPSFNRIKYLGYLRKIPALLFGAAHYFKEDRYRKVSFLQHDHPLADYLLLRGLFVPDDIAQILDTDVREVNEVLFGENNMPELGPYNKEHAAWFETNLYMQNQLLRDTDVLSMSHGLEVRVPFLDEDFQQLVQRIAPAIRFNSKQPKRLLIDSFKGVLPDEVWNRPKMGFTFPLQEWMSKHPEISNLNRYKGKPAQTLVRSFKEGHLHWSKIFALYQVQLNN
ncbi:asparagine synthase (glutamine-hydrolyzing) [Mucilaginibacter xinganensis]|uniref:asparagine synthase (glutamine-hydrolyzing) n=1 Tax=Mucilaginibacter xinganensis TaxID=1234841 RepID=A0A223P3U2_9SPHI|nr:asparagine synthase (glutamine-hydrolyzing) [Mucilaginibacter xinganensis]ASU36809.1 asparagine synthase (glutamine-hydrolyzing) [Mucilaginibacter xinganensis]